MVRKGKKDVVEWVKTTIGLRPNHLMFEAKDAVV